MWVLHTMYHFGVVRSSTPLSNSSLLGWYWSDPASTFSDFPMMARHSRMCRSPLLSTSDNVELEEVWNVMGYRARPTWSRSEDCDGLITSSAENAAVRGGRRRRGHGNPRGCCWSVRSRDRLPRPSRLPSSRTSRTWHFRGPELPSSSESASGRPPIGSCRGNSSANTCGRRWWSRWGQTSSFHQETASPPPCSVDPRHSTFPLPATPSVDLNSWLSTSQESHQNALGAIPTNLLSPCPRKNCSSDHREALGERSIARPRRSTRWNSRRRPLDRPESSEGNRRDRRFRRRGLREPSCRRQGRPSRHPTPREGSRSTSRPGRGGTSSGRRSSWGSWILGPRCSTVAPAAGAPRSPWWFRRRRWPVRFHLRFLGSTDGRLVWPWTERGRNRSSKRDRKGGGQDVGGAAASYLYLFVVVRKKTRLMTEKPMTCQKITDMPLLNAHTSSNIELCT